MLHANQGLAYRAASAEGVSQIGLLTLVYSALATDLVQAGACIRRNDIAGRCKACHHALALLGHLESWDVGEAGPDLAVGLAPFYRQLRAQILRRQVQPEEAAFTALAENVLEVQSLWLQKQSELIQEQQAASLLGGGALDPAILPQARSERSWSA